MTKQMSISYIFLALSAWFYLFTYLIFRVNDTSEDLFDQNVYDNLESISGVMDRVCSCKKEDRNSHTGTIECSYGTYRDCKYTIGKQLHCILNPEGQLRRKRDLRHLEYMSYSTKSDIKSSSSVSI